MVEPVTPTVPPVVDPSAQTPPVPPVVDPKAPKYNDDQLNDLIKKNTSKELARALEAVGIKDPAELAELAKIKKNPPKDDKEDPTKAELENLKKTTGDLETRANSNEAKAEALGAGVKKENVERVVKLALSPAYEGTIAERVQKVLAEVPEFVDKSGPSFGAAHKDEKPDITDTVLNQARAAAGLKIPEAQKK